MSNIIPRDPYSLDFPKAEARIKALTDPVEAKRAADQLEAIRVCLKKAGHSAAEINKAAKLRALSLIQLGRILHDMAETGARSKGGRPKAKPPLDRGVTLKTLAVESQRASEWSALGSLEDVVVSEYFKLCETSHQDITIAGLLRLVPKDPPKSKPEKALPAVEPPAPTVILVPRPSPEPPAPVILGVDVHAGPPGSVRGTTDGIIEEVPDTITIPSALYRALLDLYEAGLAHDTTRWAAASKAVGELLG